MLTTTLLIVSALLVGVSFSAAYHSGRARDALERDKDLLRMDISTMRNHYRDYIRLLQTTSWRVQEDPRQGNLPPDPLHTRGYRPGEGVRLPG